MSLRRNKSIGRGCSHIRPYLLLFSYVILLNVAIVLATLTIHEAGHYILGHVSGCNNIRIVLFDSDNGSTYTYMKCSENTNYGIIALGGFLLVIPFGMLFFFIKPLTERYLWFVIIGFNLIISYSDIGIITNLFMMPVLLTFSGAFMLVLGETLLVDRYIYNAISKEQLEGKFLIT